MLTKFEQIIDICSLIIHLYYLLDNIYSTIKYSRQNINVVFKQLSSIMKSEKNSFRINSS